MSRQKSNIVIVIGLTILLYASCKHDPILEEGPLTDVDFPIDTTGGGNGNLDTVLFGGIPCDPDTIYFENDILPFLSSTCAQPGCHDAATAEDGVLLTDYLNIMSTGEIVPGDPFDSELYETITDPDLDDRMPPEGEDPLSSEQIQMIFDWIAQGALQNSCNSCDTNEVTFSSTIYPLVEIKCQGCHSGSQPSSGLALLDYEDISAIAFDGSFMSSIQGADGYAQMPYNANALPPCEVDLIEAWIEDGAPDN